MNILQTQQKLPTYLLQGANKYYITILLHGSFGDMLAAADRQVRHEDYAEAKGAVAWDSVPVGGI